MTKALVGLLLSVYQSHLFTFFYEQPFSPKGEVTIQSCKTCPKLIEHIEWMPVVPLATLAQDRLCYREKLCVNNSGVRYKGLRCCEKIDEPYQRMSKDLFNYVPELPHLKKQRKKLALAPNHRGMIARTYLYMRQTYHLTLPEEALAQYQDWHHQYPVSAWEHERNEKIRAIQGGDGNPYVNSSR